MPCHPVAHSRFRTVLVVAHNLARNEMKVCELFQNLDDYLSESNFRVVYGGNFTVLRI